VNEFPTCSRALREERPQVRQRLGRVTCSRQKCMLRKCRSKPQPHAARLKKGGRRSRIPPPVKPDDAGMVAGFKHETLQCSVCRDIEHRFVYSRESSEKPELPLISALPQQDVIESSTSVEATSSSSPQTRSETGRRAVLPALRNDCRQHAHTCFSSALQCPLERRRKGLVGCDQLLAFRGRIGGDDRWPRP
jgi:hypothetical protein